MLQSRYDIVKHPVYLFSELLSLSQRRITEGEFLVDLSFSYFDNVNGVVTDALEVVDRM